MSTSSARKYNMGHVDYENGVENSKKLMKMELIG
jgi:hypothetical protein